MKHHPYTEIWPLMSGDDFEKFKADIKANGLRMDVITYKGMVLDGRNRERACEAVGVTVRYADAGVGTDADALALVVSLNETPATFINGATCDGSGVDCKYYQWT